MVDVKSFIEEFLEHSVVYDPVKAHEYYLRTRQLKGRRDLSKFKSTKKKEGWAYVKNQVDEERKQKTQASMTLNKAALVQLHNTANQKREEIKNKLKEAMTQLNAASKTSDQNVKNAVNAEKAGQNKAAADQRAKLSSDLKNSLANARANYQKMREKIKADYEAELDKQYAVIRDTA